jgi:hypothetical protein
MATNLLRDSSRIWVGNSPVLRVLTPDKTVLWAGGDDFRTSMPGGYSLARASSSWVWVNGVLTSVSTNTARFADDPRTDVGLGLMLEAAGTNLVTANRNLSTWTTSNCTVTATGIAGVDGTNGASRITATSDNAKCSLAITATQAHRTMSAWVRRQSGYRNVLMSLNDGTLNHAIPAQLLDGWTRVQWSGFGANPTIAFTLANSGDSIDVDFVQLEDGIGATSEITGGATRAEETLTLPLFGALTFSTIAAAYPLVELQRRCVIDRILDHATHPVITFAACTSPLGSLFSRKSLMVEL